MRKPFLALLTGALAVVLSVGVGGSLAGGTAASAGEPAARGSDNRTTPLSEKQGALRAVGLQKLASGQLPAGTKVAKIAKGQYVELAREGEDSIWTVLGEFGTQVNSTYGGSAGPLHNQIPQPDRSVDNTTIWNADFSQPYYNDLLFDDATGENSMRNYYKEQSSGRYAVNGEVTDWVQVPYNEANYGSDYCGSIVCARTWLFVRDSVNAWYQSQLDAGKTADEINADLAKFDVWDRYDHDGDGNFNEPDGYIDHFQSIHAGMGQEVGGGAQGTDAIWSHRWYVQLTPIGGGGPTLDDGTVVPFGGTQVGGSKYWIGDYTIEPENGGVGVFAHEFAHDLGLPDEYDTSGNTGGAENSTAWWTLMSQGSYGTQTDDLGSSPTHMNAWDKFQLGWLNYELAFAGKTSAHRLGPAEYNTKQAQGVFVVLPKKSVTSNIGSPYAGEKFYYSGTADNLDTTMTREVTLPAGTVSFAAKARYNIEVGWDYAYLTVNGEEVETNLSTDDDPNNQNFGHGITGVQTSWVDLTADLSAYAGQTVTLGFRFWTDGAQQGTPGESSVPGFQIDEIQITGLPTDGAETDAGWTFAPTTGGFRATTGSETRAFNNYYLAENRQYTGYDDSLRLGPYNFGFPSLPSFVEHFPDQAGMLIWYWDTSQADNNVGDHPGEGLILPIDAHPEILHWSDDGSVMRPRLQAYDATFSTRPTDAITLHNPANGVETEVPSQPGVSVFDDLQDWWVSGDPGDAPGNGRYQSEWNSVDVPKTGTQIRIVNETKGPLGFTQIEVRPSK